MFPRKQLTTKNEKKIWPLEFHIRALSNMNLTIHTRRKVVARTEQKVVGDFKTQCDFVKDNPNGLECLGNPHNWSSNPGWIDEAKKYVGEKYESAKEKYGAVKAVADEVQRVRQAYKSGSQETESLGKELAAKQEMTDQARQALKPTSEPNK